MSGRDFTEEGFMKHQEDGTLAHDQTASDRKDDQEENARNRKHDHDVNEQHKKSLDRRMLILYILLVVLLASFVAYFQHSQSQSNKDRRSFQQAITTNCNLVRENQVHFNAFLTNLEKLLPSTSQTPTQIKQRITFYEQARGIVPTCPPPGTR